MSALEPTSQQMPTTFFTISHNYTTNFVQYPGPWILDYTDAGVQEGPVASGHDHLGFRMLGEGHVGLSEDQIVKDWGRLGA